ncbi:MFS transporter [Pseudomonadales bacterium]|nr:MFS transporter [Pseudomonadales bacterium]
MSSQHKGLASTLFATASAALLFLLLPIVVGWISDQFQLDEQQVGLIVSIYFGGFLITSVIAYFAFGKVKNLTAIQLGYFLLVPGLVLCGLATSTLPLSIGLAFCGIGSGLLYGTGVSIVSAHTESERAFGGMVATQQVIALALIYCLPVWIYPNYGYEACWLILASIVSITALSSTWISCVEVNENEPAVVNSSRTATLGIVSLLFHFCLSLAGGLAGALIAVTVGNRLGALLPHIVSAIAFIASFYFLALSSQWEAFLTSVIIFSAAWAYCLSYQMASIGNLSHRTAVLIPAVQGIGAMLGPPLGGWIIGQSGYTSLLLSAAVVIAISSLAFCYQSKDNGRIQNV